MIDLQYVIAPILGGVIGYITNDLAIRMLFRPYKAKYVFGMHIPFTPGIIPKEKERIAEAIGEVISENLMNQEVLENYLLSDDMIAKLRTSVEGFFDAQKTNEESVRKFLGHYLSNEEIQSVVNGINESLADQMGEKLANSTVGNKVAQLAMNHVAGRLNGDGAQVLLGGLGGALRGLGGAAAALFGGNVVGRFLGLLREPAERFLANNINDMLRGNGQQMVSNMIDGEIDSFLDKKVCTLLEGHDEQLANAVNTIESIYRTIIQKHLPQILETIDISKIVCDRINEMDVAETEKLIFRVMKKELKAIVWLGAGLGFLMGWVNVLF